MAMSLEQFAKWFDQNKARINEGKYRLADLEVNGDPNYYREVGEFVEKNPIYHPTVRRG